MHDLHHLDQSMEEPVYNSATIAELHHMGKLSRSEAEAFDILDTHFITEAQEDKPTCASRVEEPLERSYIAIIHEGSILPILNLEERMQRPTTLTEKLLLSTRIASAIFDVLLVFLEEEGGEDNEHSGPI